MELAEAIIYAFAGLFVLAIIIIVGAPITSLVIGKIAAYEKGGHAVADFRQKFEEIGGYMPLAATVAVFLALFLFIIKTVWWGAAKREEAVVYG